MKPASLRAAGEPAGRGPRSTWYLSHFQARSSSKRSTFVALVSAIAVACAAVALGFGVSPLPHAPSANAQISVASIGLVVGGHRLEEVREALAGRFAAGRDVLARGLARLVAAQDAPCDRLAVDLVGPVVEPGGARVAVHLLERQVGAVAERAVGL